ncbi:MAG: hypothetical protein QOE65_1784 [Solirubrobacteraceae bacterium]|jgi:RNA polymerase sigma factor (sigma-70 family)|nr:hypothetical protein [Solirubrobacteraceae bacterium]
MRGIGTVADLAVEADPGLVASVREGDDRAFEELYARYHPRIAAYVRGMVRDHARAEDVTQEVFFSALRRMRQTERPIAFKAWIYEIARNACIDAYRRTSRAEELSYDAEGGLPPADSVRLVSRSPEPDDAVESKQRLDDLCGAFGGLSETHHQILVLRELEGLSYREIGERLGMSRAAVESTLFRARRRLSEEYDELVSGRRCQRVQAIIAAAAQGMLGTRDRRRLERHVTTCHSCRRQALHLGLDVAERRSAVARIAGLLPFPVPVLLARGRGADGGGVAGASGTGFVAQASTTLGAASEPLAAAWSKGVAAVAMLAVAGAGAGAVTQQAGVGVPGLDRAAGPSVRHASRAAAIATPPARAGALDRAAAPGPVASPRARRGIQPTVRETVAPAAPRRTAQAGGGSTATTGPSSSESPRVTLPSVTAPASGGTPGSGGTSPADGRKVPIELSGGQGGQPQGSPAEPSPAAAVRAVQSAADDAS